MLDTQDIVRDMRDIGLTARGAVDLWRRPANGDGLSSVARSFRCSSEGLRGKGGDEERNWGGGGGGEASRLTSDWRHVVEIPRFRGTEATYGGCGSYY